MFMSSGLRFGSMDEDARDPGPSASATRPLPMKIPLPATQLTAMSRMIADLASARLAVARAAGHLTPEMAEGIESIKRQSQFARIDPPAPSMARAAEGSIALANGKIEGLAPSSSSSNWRDDFVRDERL